MNGSSKAFFGNRRYRSTASPVRFATPFSRRRPAPRYCTVGLGQRAGIFATGAVFVGSMVRSLLTSRRSGEQGEDGSEVVQ